MPGDIAVRWAKEVPDDFHARFSATARRYRYIIFNHNLRPGIMSQGVSHYHGELDETRMHQAGQFLLGENDFTSFRAVQCQSKSPWRNVMHLKVTRHGHYVIVDIKANAFVHHMVRNIVGSLIVVGKGEQEPEWIKWLLEAKDRKLAAAPQSREACTWWMLITLKCLSCRWYRLAHCSCRIKRHFLLIGVMNASGLKHSYKLAGKGR